MSTTLLSLVFVDVVGDTNGGGVANRSCSGTQIEGVSVVLIRAAPLPTLAYQNPLVPYILSVAIFWS